VAVLVVVGLCGLLVGAVVVSGTPDGLVSGPRDAPEAHSGGEGLARLNSAFPIPNASGVGIGDMAVLDAPNETVYVFGAASCTGGEILEVDVEVTQASTGAVASGETATYCLGAGFVQTWIVLAEPTGQYAFESGEARVEAGARTQVEGTTTDTVRWNDTVSVSETYPNESVARI
jgi:hypothetical protein